MTKPASASTPPFISRPGGGPAPLLVVAIGGVLSVWVFFSIRSAENRGREQEFSRRAQNIALRAEDYLGRREEAVYTLRAMFETSPHVSRAQFERVARELLSRQVGIYELQWVPIVPGAERARYEAAARAEGFPRFEFTEHADDPPGTLRRSADRPVHAPVYYVVPYAGNEPALGFDMASAPSAWAKLQGFARQGVLAASGRVPLLVAKADPPNWGYITELPVYDQPIDDLAPEARLAHLKGYIFGVFRLSDVLEDMFNRMSGHGVDVLFLDESATPERRFLHYHTATPEPGRTSPPTVAMMATGMHLHLNFEHAGRTWSLWMRPSAAWRAQQSGYRSWFFGSLLLGLSIGLGLYLRTQRHRAELVARLVAERTAELRDSQRKLDAFLHALPGMAYRGVYAQEFEVTYVSEGSIALTGYRPEEFLSGRVHLRDLIHPDDLPHARKVTRAAAAAGVEIEAAYRLRAVDGTEKWVLSRGRSPGLDGRGRPLFEGLAIDITAQKRAEHDRLALERKLLDGQKLESLGLLAGGIAHDFNNLLTGVLGNAGLARLSVPPGSPIEPQLRAIEHSALRAAELCRQMLAYAGKGRFVIESADLTLLVEALLPLLNTSIARRAELRLEMSRDLPAVMADATQLRQIVMNLVLNAADAMGPEGGTITIRTGRAPADAAFLATCAAGSDLPPGEFVLLEVSDTGCGMAPEVVARIFDPFFTTKFAGRGLGLAAALGIVRGHRGALHVCSTVGRGSRFQLLLPPTAERGTLPTAITPPESTWRRAGHVLVVDDEEPVRLVAADMLKSVGLTPRVVNDGLAGIAVFRENPAHYELVLLDLMMPAQSGEETLAALRAIKPGVRVLLMSGYSEGDLLRRLAHDRSPVAFLPKPFTRDALVEKLRVLLG
ncbi:MAG: CHASE domain-containing protein [Verrucomicrobia bacterium]|nr:CHASE domain-containing protein [Verrucomicrobiota bacterium]